MGLPAKYTKAMASVFHSEGREEKSNKKIIKYR
jgi:hypothetical protein